MRSILLTKMKRGNRQLVELLEDQLQGRHLLVVGLGDDNGGIATGQRIARLLGEFDRTRSIDEGEGFAEKIDGSDIELDAHAVSARLGGGITDGCLVADPALALNRTGSEKNGLEQSGFAAQIGAHQRYASRALRCSAA